MNLAELKQYFSYLAPVLFMTWLALSCSRLTMLHGLQWKYYKPAALGLSAVLALYRFGDLSFSEYLLSLNPNFSVGSIALLLISSVDKFRHKKILSSSELLLFSLWNIFISLLLYASFLGFFSFDLYSSGYGFSPWFMVPAFLTILLSLRRSPLAFIFLGYIAAFDLKLLPSDNFLDYITDGFLFLVSLGIVTAKVLAVSKANSKSRIKHA